MIKVDIKKSVNVNELERVLEEEGILYDEVINCVKENGDGVYEIKIGCRGGLDGVEKNDEYMSFDELVECVIDEEWSEEDIEDLKEFYGVIECDNDCFVMIGYFEESVSYFVSVKN